MRYVVVAIGVTVIGVVALMVASGHATWRDLTMLVVAVVLVCFFGALPVVLGLRRGRGKPAERVVLRKDGQAAEEGTGADHRRSDLRTRR